ncbi:hypothetical protein KHQ82_06770 [Mycoplasmatota bacterium]|nr:hypothetical protein KHQ82_06770 [Mycoplasmatota bacterium]
MNTKDKRRNGNSANYKNSFKNERSDRNKVKNRERNQFEDEFAEEITIEPTGTTFIGSEFNKTKTNRNVNRREYEKDEY